MTTFSSELFIQMRQFAATLHSIPTRVVRFRPIYHPPELKTFLYVFVKVDPFKRNSVPANAGPYVVESRTDNF